VRCFSPSRSAHARSLLYLSCSMPSYTSSVPERSRLRGGAACQRENSHAAPLGRLRSVLASRTCLDHARSGSPSRRRGVLFP
jgi:hypothetical protein